MHGHVEHCAQFVRAGGLQIARAARIRIPVQHLDRAQATLDVRDQLLYGEHVTHVAGEGLHVDFFRCQFLRGSVQALGIARDDCNAIPLLCEAARDRVRNTHSVATNDNGFSHAPGLAPVCVT